ncbi:MAG: GAF domain-containing protein, partial [Bacteroidetes bacterium]|nr:GAF domain-containing protein [Bacteroidota bacterium]
MKETTSPKVDSAQIDHLIASSFDICRSNPHKGIELADKALFLSDISDSLKIAQATVCKGACQVWLGDYENALKNLLEHQHEFEKFKDDKFEAHALYHIFCAFYFLADYDNALKYALDMLARAKKNKDILAQANAYNGIGTVYHSSGENEKAIEVLSKGLVIAEKLADKHLLARILDGIGSSYFNLNNIERSIEFKQKSLDAARSIGLKNTESFGLDGLAQIYLAAKDLVKAEKLFKECLSIREELNFKFGISETNLQLGNLYLEMNQLEKASAHLKISLEIANESNSKEIIYKAHEAFSKLYEKQKNTEKFVEHYKNYFANKEDFFKEQNKQKLKGVELQFSISQMEKEKELLNEKNKQLELLSNDLVVLSDLGKKIISQLSVENINNTVYEIINNLMDAAGFGIGVVSEDKKKLIFPGYIEKGVVLSSSGYDLSDNDRLAPVCFNKEIEIVINDYDLELEKFITKRLNPVVGESVQSIIYLPLKIADKKIGVLTVQSFKKNAFNDYHVNLVKNLAVYCALALENATSYQRLEERVVERTSEVIQQKEEIERSQEKTRLLNVIGQQIISSTSFDSIFAKLHENVSQLMNADCFSIRIYNEEKHEIDYRYSFEKGELSPPINVSMNDIDNFSVWCVTNKREIFINDNVNEYQKYTSKIVVPHGEMPSSLLFCPMMIGDRVIGVITVQSFHKNAYVPSHIDILKTLGTYTAIALENAHLVEHLEEKVKERTSEVVEQKEQVEKSFRNTELIGEIGKEITSTLSVDEIISKVYEQVNTLMDATIFGIGVFRSEKDDLYFSGAIEKGI